MHFAAIRVRPSPTRGLLAVALWLLAGCRAAPPPPSAVTVITVSDVLSLDPNKDVEAVTDSVLWNTYESLVTFDADLQPRPLLAESWEHPAPERWRFHLRPNVRFQDGSALDADAVKASFDSLRATPDRESGSFLQQVASVEAVGRDVVEIVTREPRALLAQLPFIYVTRPAPAGAVPAFIGTGPYRIREWQKGHRVVMERWDGYWGARPAFATATFETVADPAQRLARVAGGADLAYQVPPEALGETHAGVKLLRRPGLTVYYLGLDVRKDAGNPLHDVRVRRAIHLALDRERLVREVLGGAGQVPTQLVSPLVFGYDPSLPHPLPDVDTARALLRDAGYGAGLKLRFDVPVQRRDLAWRIQENLRAVGIELELNAIESDAVYDLAEQGRSRLYFAGWNCTTGEASEAYEFLLHTRTTNLGKGNYGGYSDAELDEIAERNAAVLDARERRAMLQRAAAITMRDLPLVPVVVEDDVYGVREGLRFEPRADGEIRLMDLAPAAR